jgi:hypothetical protein
MNLWSFTDEKQIAEELVKNKKKINENTNEKIVAYIKYLKQNKKSKRDIRNELDDLMIKNYKGFIMADWDSKLQRYVNKYSKQDNSSYRTSKIIQITKRELEFIKNIGDIGGVKSIEIEKVLYCMLVLAKSTYKGSEKEDYWCNYDSRDIFRLARFKYKQKSVTQFIQRESLIYDLDNFKKDVFSLGGKNIKLLYGQKQIKEDDIIINVELNERTAENMIVEYLKWRNKEDYNFCEVCGKEIQLSKNNSPQKYCNKHQKEIKNEQNKKYYHKNNKN